MPQWRKLHVKTVESFDVNEMPDDFTRLLWVLLPLKLDSAGRGINDASWIRSNIFPLRCDVTLDMVAEAMAEFVHRGMVEYYEVDNRGYFCIPTFEQYQGNTSRESPSHLPPPNSRPTHDLLTTNSRPPLDQDAQRSSTDVDSDVDVDSDAEEKQTTDKDAEKDETAVAADFVESFTKELLANFGVEEPWLSDLASTCSEQDVRDWIAYVEGRWGVKNPTGFLISRLRTGESPPVEKADRWFTGDDFKKIFVQPGELPEEESDATKV